MARTSSALRRIGGRNILETEENKLNRTGNEKLQPAWKQDRDSQPLGYKFKLINDKFTKYRNETLKKDDLTFSQSKILFYLLWHQDEKVTQKDLCEAVHVKHPTMIGLLNRLEEKEMIVRNVDPENKRCRIISMTDKASAFLEKNKERHEDRDRMLVRGMSDEEIRTLRRLLDIVYQNMKDI